MPGSFWNKCTKSQELWSFETSLLEEASNYLTLLSIEVRSAFCKNLVLQSPHFGFSEFLCFALKVPEERAQPPNCKVFPFSRPLRSNNLLFGNFKPWLWNNCYLQSETFPILLHFFSPMCSSCSWNNIKLTTTFGASCSPA